MINSNDKKYSIIKIIVISLIVLSVFSVIRTLSFNQDMKNFIIEDVQRDARVLKDYLTSVRKVYQHQFLKNAEDFDSSNLKFLPAYTSSKISEEFVKINKDAFYVKTVSQNPRNPKSMADSYEMLSINYFKNNVDKEEYFFEYIKDKKSFYQYSSPIYIQEHCLACHGKKEDTLQIIQDNYEKSYNYKVGDLIGIVSIKIPQANGFEKLYKFIFQEMIFSILSLIMIFVILINLYKITKREIKEIDEKASVYAFTDGLTGLYNRHYLNNFLDKFTSLRKEDSSYAVVFIDIDDFKLVNDLLGHAAGDCILKNLAQHLKSLSRPKDTLCRYGGEEFVIVFSDILRADTLEKVQQIRTSIEQYNFKCKKQNITVSIGVSFGTTSDDINIIMQESDKALYMAKTAGKNCVKVFDLE